MSYLCFTLALLTHRAVYHKTYFYFINSYSGGMLSDSLINMHSCIFCEIHLSNLGL